MKTVMIRLSNDSLVCFVYNTAAEAYDKINALEILKVEKTFYCLLLYEGIERVTKRGKIMFEITNINPDDLEG